MYVFNILHLGYLGFSVYLVYQLPKAIFITNLVVLALYFLVWPVITRYLYVDIGWRLYRKFGADPHITSEPAQFSFRYFFYY